MNTLDLHNNVKYTGGLYPKAAVTDNTPYESEIIDTANAAATEWVMINGTATDADVTFTLLIEDGDDSALSDSSAVDDSLLLGDEDAGNGSFTFAEDDTVIKIGYIGAKRYVRATITPADNGAGNHFLAGIWVQTSRKHQTDQQV